MQNQTKSNSTTPPKLDREKKGIKDSYSLFKKKYWSSELGLPKKRGKIRMPYSIYKKIISAFLRVYFEELYFSNKKYLYFFLGGDLKLVRQVPRLMTYGGQNRMSGHAISFLWYNRANKDLWRFVKIKRMRGLSNIIPKLDAKYKEKKDIFSLDPVKKAIREKIKSGNLFDE